MGGLLYYKSIQLPQLRTFCVAATEVSFTAAARVLGLSPPVVWQQVRALERELGTSLLRRSGRAIELTPEGRLLLELIQPHVSGLDSLVQLFKMRCAGLPRQLSFASTNYFLSYNLSTALRDFTAAHPSVRLRVRAGTWAEVLQFVEQGGAELGVAPYDGNAPRSPHLEYEPLAVMQFLLLTPRDHPLARKRRVRPQDLAEHPLIVPPPYGHGRAALERIAQRHQLADRLHVVMEIAPLDIVAKYVALGIGVALVYAVADRLEPAAGLRYRRVDCEADDLPVALLVRRGAHLSEPLEALRGAVRHALRPRAGGRHPAP